MMKTTAPLSSYFYLYLFIAFTGWFSSLVVGQATNTTNTTITTNTTLLNGTLTNQTLAINGTRNNTNVTAAATNKTVYLNTTVDYINRNLDQENLTLSLGAANGGVLNSSESRGLSGGQIAGIVVGSAAGLALLAGLLVFGLRKKRTPAPTPAPVAPMAPTSPGPVLPKVLTPVAAPAPAVVGDGNPAAVQAAIAAAPAAAGAVHTFQVSEAKPMMLTDDGEIVELKAVNSASPQMVQRDEIPAEQAVSLSADGNLTT